MQIHCDDVIAPGGLQHVRDEFCGDGRAGFILLVLSGVGEVWDHGGDAAGARGFAGVDHDEEFHEVVVDAAGGRGLEDKHIFVADGLGDGDGGFEIRGVLRYDLGELDTEADGGGTSVTASLHARHAAQKNRDVNQDRDGQGRLTDLLPSS